MTPIRIVIRELLTEQENDGQWYFIDLQRPFARRRCSSSVWVGISGSNRLARISLHVDDSYGVGQGCAGMASDSNGWKIGIREGEYRLESAGDCQVLLQDDRITVRRDKRTIVAVTAKPRPDMALSNSKKAIEDDPDPDRRAAQWLLSQSTGPGNNIGLEFADGTPGDLSHRQLPEAPFRVRVVWLQCELINTWGDRLADELKGTVGGTAG